MSGLLARWHKLSTRKQWLIAIGVLLLAFSGIGALSGGGGDTAPAATAAPAVEATDEPSEAEANVYVVASKSFCTATGVDDVYTGDGHVPVLAHDQELGRRGGQRRRRLPRAVLRRRD